MGSCKGPCGATRDFASVSAAIICDWELKLKQSTGDDRGHGSWPLLSPVDCFSFIPKTSVALGVMAALFET